MATLSDADTRYLLTGAGFSTINAVIGSQIAWAESRRDTMATHHNTNGSTDYGLMQINSIHLGTHLPNGSVLSPSNVFDPYTNVLAAYSIWKDAGGSWRPWSTFNSGAYRNAHDTMRSGTLTPVGIGSRGTSGGHSIFGIPVGVYLEGIKGPLFSPLARGVLADQAVNGKGISKIAGQVATTGTNTVMAVPDTAHAVADFLGKLSDWNLWNRIGLGAIAVAVVLLGIIIWIEPDAVKAVSKLPIIPV